MINPCYGKLEPSLIRLVNGQKKAGDVDLGLGEPIFPVDTEPLSRAVERVAREGCRYGLNAGSQEVREALIARLQYATIEHAEQVCLTVGSEEALYLAVRTAFSPGDELLFVGPAFASVEKTGQAEGLLIRRLNLSPHSDFAPSAEAVLEALGPETRGIALCSPSNPTGRVWPAHEVEALAEGLLSRPGPPVTVIWDEAYVELYYGAERPTSLAQYYPHTLVAGSVSKSHALTGLRIGWLAGPHAHIAAACRLHQLSVTSASTFSQWVLLELLRDPCSFQRHRPLYAARRAVMADALSQAGLHAAPMEGAFYAFIRLEGLPAQDSLATALALIAHDRVVTVPGRAFGPGGEGWLRASFAADPPILQEGVRRLRAGLDRLSEESARP